MNHSTAEGSLMFWTEFEPLFFAGAHVVPRPFCRSTADVPERDQAPTLDWMSTARNALVRLFNPHTNIIKVRMIVQP